MNPVKVQPGVWSVIDGIRHYDLHVEPEGENYVVSVHGRSTRVKIQDPRAWASAGAGKNSTGLAKISTPMPGKVVRILVAVGDRVEAGKGVVVVEAMKMQNEMQSPIAGVVKAINATEGATVNGNQVLVVIEADAS